MQYHITQLPSGYEVVIRGDKFYFRSYMTALKFIGLDISAEMVTA